MTAPKELKVGMEVLYNNINGRSYGPDAWNGSRGIVLMVDDKTDPFQYVKVQLQYPYGDGWQPILWTERYNLRKLPNRKGGK